MGYTPLATVANAHYGALISCLPHAQRRCVPAAYRAWIERGYQLEPWVDEPTTITEKFDRFSTNEFGRYFAARQLSKSEATPWPDAEGAAARLTRDGDMNQRLLHVQTIPTRRLALLSGEPLAALSEGEPEASRVCCDEAPDVAEHPQAQPLSRAKGAVEFQGVSFGYKREQPILHDVSFAIPAGTRLGIAGKTGAGKSTLVSLLMRFYDPNTGQVLLDGVDVRNYKLADVGHQFAMVMQEPVRCSSGIDEQ